MKLLIRSGFVTAEKRGRWVYYDLVPETFRSGARLRLRRLQQFRVPTEADT